MKTWDDIMAELLQEFPEEEVMIHGLSKEGVADYLALSSQGWAIRPSVQRAFLEHRFEEVTASQEKAAKLFAIGMKLKLTEIDGLI